MSADLRPRCDQDGCNKPMHDGLCHDHALCTAILGDCPAEAPDLLMFAEEVARAAHGMLNRKYIERARAAIARARGTEK